MHLNIKTGFNRSFVVCTVLWAAYCLFVYPIQKGGEAFDKEMKDTRNCYEAYQNPDELRDCLNTTKDLSRTEEDSWKLKNYYRGGWPILLIVVVVFPLVLYGGCRGAAATFMWVVKGFQS